MSADGGGASRSSSWADEWDECPDDDEYGDDGHGDEDDVPEDGRDWRRAKGIFILAPIGGEAGERIAELQRIYDPKLAAMNAPHLTMAGSSGVGPVAAGTSDSLMREALEPVVREVPPLVLGFSSPVRFMQTNIVSLPLDPNGPIRELFDRIRASGLTFGPVRFAFTPHATLSYFPTLDRARERALLAERVTAPAVIDRLELSMTNDPQPPRKLFELMLEGRR
ncbi:MAG: 2'-5' RNA ligase family protein [Gemmatimonadaceae bacterium]